MYSVYITNMRLWPNRTSKRNPQPQNLLENSEPENGKTHRFYHLRQCLEGFLADNLPPKEALVFIKEINSCSSETDLKDAGQRIALLVDDSTGEGILKLFEKDKFLEITF